MLESNGTETCLVATRHGADNRDLIHVGQVTIQQAFDLAVHHHGAGRLQEAEQLYRQILAQQPNHAGALHYLGIIAFQGGRNDVAVDLIRRSIDLEPNCAEAHSNLGNVLKDQGRIDEAAAAYGQAIALRPDMAEAHSNLGTALKAQGRLDAAIVAYHQAIVLRPDYAEAHNNLGNALQDRGQLGAAIDAYRKALALRPDYAKAHSNLGNALKDAGQPDEALAAYRQAIALRPDLSEAHSNLGNLLRENGQIDEAITACQKAIACNPDFPAAHNNLGNALRDREQLDAAIDAYRQAIVLKPNYAVAHINLGNALKDNGQLDDAIAAYRQAFTHGPNLPEAHSNLLFGMHFHPDYDAGIIAEEHRRWNRQHAEPLAKFVQPHPNERNPERRLRIGYVSADFREHPVGIFLLPLLEHHDHQQFDVFCYYNRFKADDLTTRIRTHAKQWRQIAGQSDQDAAARIREDGIDILVDLSGHTAGNRLLVFARKPAPVQVSYLGYPGTTGLTTIDYRLTDAWADPPDSTDCFHSEQLHRLPHSNWCIAEMAACEQVGPLPAIERGYVTFGSFNNLAKLTESMLHVWGRILLAVPNSRLMLKASGLAAPSSRERIRRQFASMNIDTGRLILRGWEPTHATHLALHGEVDIALDPFPYHGTSTTCDALWMGVPVVTLAGQSHVSLVGLSMLANIGLPELATTSVEQYVAAATELARDVPRLASLRSSLRERLRRSPLMDAPRFAKDIEAAYRLMWRRWCKGQAAPR